MVINFWHTASFIPQFTRFSFVSRDMRTLTFHVNIIKRFRLNQILIWIKCPFYLKHELKSTWKNTQISHIFEINGFFLISGYFYYKLERFRYSFNLIYQRKITEVSYVNKIVTSPSLCRLIVDLVLVIHKVWL